MVESTFRLQIYQKAMSPFYTSTLRASAKKRSDDNKHDTLQDPRQLGVREQIKPQTNWTP